MAVLVEGAFLMPGAVWEREIYARRCSTFCLSWKTCKSFGVFCCCFVWFSALPADEELSSLKPLTKTRGLHKSTAHHMTHAVIYFGRFYDWVSNKRVWNYSCRKFSYFYFEVEVTLEEKLLALSASHYFFHGFVLLLSSDIGKVWNGDEKRLASHSCFCCKAGYWMLDPNIKRVGFTIHGFSVWLENIDIELY